MAFASAAWCSQPGSGHRFARGADRIERIGLRAVAACGPLRAVQLDDDLRALQQVTAQAGAVAAGPFDGPGSQRRVVVGELHQFGVALGCRLDGDLIQDATGRGVQDGRGVGVDVGVDADDDIDHSRRSVRLSMRSLLLRTGRGSGPGRRFGRTVMRHARRR